MSDGADRHQPPKRPAPERRPRWRAMLSRIDWLSDKLVQSEELIEALSAPPVDGDGNPVVGWRPNGAPIAALLKSQEGIRDKLDRELAGRPNVLEGMTPEELLAYLQPVVSEWPDAVLEMVLGVYGERHRGRILFVSETGHRSELEPGEGWTRITEG